MVTLSPQRVLGHSLVSGSLSENSRSGLVTEVQSGIDNGYEVIITVILLATTKQFYLEYSYP